jgi:hypothetical protein
MPTKEAIIAQVSLFAMNAGGGLLCYHSYPHLSGLCFGVAMWCTMDLVKLLTTTANVLPAIEICGEQRRYHVCRKHKEHTGGHLCTCGEWWFGPETRV